MDMDFWYAFAVSAKIGSLGVPGFGSGTCPGCGERFPWQSLEKCPGCGIVAYCSPVSLHFWFGLI